VDSGTPGAGIDTSPLVQLDGGAVGTGPDAGFDSGATGTADSGPDLGTEGARDLASESLPDLALSDLSARDLASADFPVGDLPLSGALDLATTPERGSTGIFVPATGPLVLDVAAASNPVTAAGRLFYEVTISNVTAQAMSGVSLSLLLPASLQFNGVADANPDASCYNNACAASTRATWTIGTLGAGMTQVVTINAQVISAAVTNGDSISSAFTLSATGASSLTVTKAVQVFGAPQAQLTLGSATNPMAANGEVTYDIDIGQIGTVALAGTTLRAFLSPGLIVSGVSDGGTQSAANPGEIDWDIGAVGIGASLHRSVRVTGDGTAPAGSVLPARAVLAYAGTDPSVNAEFSVAVVGAPQALTVAWDVAGAPAAPTGRLLHTLTIGNLSARPVAGVALVLRLPSGLQFNGVADANPDASCYNNACLANTEAAWAIGTLAAGASTTIAVNTQVITAAAPDGTLLSAHLTVEATGLDAFNLVKTTPVFGESQARLTFGTATNPVTPTGTFTYDLDVGNTGSAALTGAALRAFIPAGLSVAAISDGGTQTAPGQIDWSVGTLAVGASVHRTLRVTAGGSVAAGGFLQARAVLTHVGGLETDGAADYSVAVVAAMQPLLVDVSAASGPALPSGRLLYTMTISNVSLQAISGVSLIFPVPAGLQFNGVSDADPDSNCYNNGCTADVESAWTLGTIAPGASVSVEVNTQVAASLADGTLISARPTVAATGLDPIIVAKTVEVYGKPAAQLAFTTAINPVVPGGALTYDIAVGQLGATPLTGTTLRAFLPPGVTVAAISDGGTQVAAGEVDWPLGTVAVGATAHRSVQVTTDSTLVAGAQLVAHATLTYDGGLEVDVASDETVSVVGVAPALAVTLTAAPNPTTHGTRLLYTLGITNNTARPVDGVSVMFPVPQNLQFNGASDALPAGSCYNNACAANVEAAWTLGTLAAGITKTITVNALVASTVLSGVLIPATFEVNATGLDSPILAQTTVSVQ
jgi:hypothetical protein